MPEGPSSPAQGSLTPGSVLRLHTLASARLEWAWPSPRHALRPRPRPPGAPRRRGNSRGGRLVAVATQGVGGASAASPWQRRECACALRARAARVREARCCGAAWRAGNEPRGVLESGRVGVKAPPGNPGRSAQLQGLAGLGGGSGRGLEARPAGGAAAQGREAGSGVEADPGPGTARSKDGGRRLPALALSFEIKVFI